MAKKKKQNEVQEIVYAPILPQPITETIEKNYMPYTMSVIVSRAIPEIDGFKSSIESMNGDSNGKILSTPTPLAILRTVNVLVFADAPRSWITVPLNF